MEHEILINLLFCALFFILGFSIGGILALQISKNKIQLKQKSYGNIRT